MMGEAGNRHIFLRFEAEGIAIALRGVLNPVNGEFLRIFPELCIKNALETPLPSGSEGLVRVLGNCLHISLKHSVKL